MDYKEHLPLLGMDGTSTGIMIGGEGCGPGGGGVGACGKPTWTHACLFFRLLVLSRCLLLSMSHDYIYLSGIFVNWIDFKFELRH